MRFAIFIFFILVSLSCSCFSPPLPPERLPGEEYDTAPSFPTETDYPKEIIISGTYTFTNNDRSFQFESTDYDIFCYKTRKLHSSEEFVPLRFRLYNKEGKLLSEGLPAGGERLVREFNEKITEYPEKDIKGTAFVPSSILYHRDGVKIKVILVDDEGKDLKVLAERRALSIEEIRKRFFYEGCHRSEGFVIL